MKDTTVIIPTLNEEGNITKMVTTLQKLYPGITVIVSDDGSKDKTQELARKKGALVIDRSKKKVKGLTASILDGVFLTKTNKVIVIDCDFQHPPEKVHFIAKKLDVYDVVVGKRVKMEGWPLSRKIISWGGTLLAEFALLIRLKKPFPDPMSGFFGMKTALFKQLERKRFVEEGFKVLFDAAKILPRGTKVSTVGYEFGLRSAGESKISSRHMKAMLKSMIR